MLYLVSTPIGNLSDISLRAIEVLGQVDVILAEDTRRTAVLLRHHGIASGRLISAHEHNEAARADLLIELLSEGKEVALVSDAGTPLISDPGARLVRSALEAGFQVVPIPGSSALLAALVASGLPADRFTFLGFIPRKGSARAELLTEIAGSPHTTILYESPRRISALLGDLREYAGGDRPVAIARELTKIHEELYRATLDEAVEAFRDRDVKGEIVVVVGGSPAPAPPEDHDARVLAEALLDQGLAPSRVARELRDRLGMPRNAAYQLVRDLAENRGASTGEALAVSPPDP